jgi:hypothetical protein
MPEGARRSRRPDRSLEERLEGWIDRGLDFVDGVAAGRGAAPRRRPLEAISRRGQAPAADGWEDDWPDDASFSLNRWQRPDTAAPAPQPSVSPPPQDGRRPLPRSSRRRP